ncbi:MAG: LysR family transcriptional regulator [Lachnospiraceae bacterium]|nr:LysR family transcriptional regulator [Lachnospiraceae bacterium]
MNYSYLKYIVEIEKTGSITKAAQNLYMNQPHLSKILREIERDFGMPIFHRTSRGMVPSENGEAFLRQAHSLLAQMKQMDMLCRSDQPKKYSLKLFVPRVTYISSAFTDFISQLDSERSLDILYRETSTRETIQAVSDKRCDLGIIRIRTLTESYEKKQLADENLICEELFSFSCQLLMSQAHPLAHQTDLNYLMLQDYIELVHGDSNPPSFTFDSGDNYSPDGSSSTISIYERGSQFELLNRNPRCYMWTAPIPYRILAATDLVQRPCSIPGNQYQDLLICRNDYRFSQEAKRFVQSLNRMISQLSDG